MGGRFPVSNGRGRGRWQALHHPFTCAQDATTSGCWTARRATACRRAYDMVPNGTEVGGGPIRIHRDEIQQKVFHLLGIGKKSRRKIRLPADCAEIRLPTTVVWHSASIA